MKRILLLFLSFYVLTSCYKKEKNHTINKPIHISIASDVRSFDPRIGNELPSTLLINMLFEGLMRVDLEGEVKPALAKKIIISEDQKRYKFLLRPSIWRDGKKVTAYDFEYAWKKCITPTSLSQGAQHYYLIKNAKAVAQGRIPVDQVGITAEDENTLVVELEHPAPYFYELIASPLFFPIPKHLDEKGVEWSGKTGKILISNGPFQLVKWKRDNELILEKNLRYWDAENVALQGINIQIIKDGRTQICLFEKGELDWVGSPFSSIPFDSIQALKQTGNFHSVDSLFVFWFFVNTEKFPFNNKKFRQALSCAISRDEIAKNVFEEEGKAAQSILASCISLHENRDLFCNNQLVAKKLFEEALVEMEIHKEELPKIFLSCCSFSEIHNRLTQAIQEDWRRVLGLTISIEQTDWPIHFDNILKGNYQVGLMGWLPIVKDPIAILEIFKDKGNGSNMSRWEDPIYQKILDSSDQASDENKRKELLKIAEEIIVDEMPVIPICFIKKGFGKNSRLKNVYVAPNGQIEFKYASLVE